MFKDYLRLIIEISILLEDDYIEFVDMPRLSEKVSQSLGDLQP